MKPLTTSALTLLAALLGLSGCTTAPRLVDDRQGQTTTDEQATERQAVQEPGTAATQIFLVALHRWESNAVVWDAGGQFRVFDNGYWRLDIPRIYNNRVWETPTRFRVWVDYFDKPGCPGTPVHTQQLLSGEVAVRQQVVNLHAESVDPVVQSLASQLRCARVTRQQTTGHAG